MLAFIHDSFVTSYKWFNPVTVDALDMDNGLVLLSFGPQCIGLPHPVRHSVPSSGVFSL